MGLLSDLRPELPEARPIKQSGGGPAPSPASLRGNPELVRAAVAAIPNTSELFPSREDFIQVGYAIKAAVADETEAFGIFLTWCGRWDMGLNDPEKAAAEWRRMPGPYKRGANWLFELAQEYGGYVRGAEWFDEGLAMQAVKAEHDNVVRLASRYRFLTVSEAAVDALMHGHKPLIKGLIDVGTLSVMYGAPNSGKSFLAFLMAYCIAMGIPFAGLRTTKMRSVVVAAEGGNGSRQRAAALVKTLGPCDDFFILMSAVDLYDPRADLVPLVQAVNAIGGVGFVVFDTLNRVMAGGDENSTKDMSAFVKNLDAFRAQTGTHVMLNHHSGKDATRGARGSSALLGAVDTEIELADGQLTVTKQRDHDKSFSAAFTIESVPLGRDADGDMVTSGVARVAADAAAITDDGPVATPAEAKVIAAVAELQTTLGKAESGVSQKEIVDFLEDLRAGIRGDTVRFHLRALLAKKLVKRLGRGLWALKSVKNVLVPEDRASSARHMVVEMKSATEGPRRGSGGSIFD